MAIKANFANCSYVTALRNQIPNIVTQYFIEGLATTVFVMFGLVGNALSIHYLMVHFKKRIRHTLISLAICDTILLASAWGYYSLWSLFSFSHHFGHPIFAIFTTVFHPIAHMSFTASALLTVVLTFERCVMVCMPLSSKFRLKSTMQSRFLVALACAMSIVANFPTIFELKLNTCIDPLTLKTYKEVSATRFRYEPYYMLYYRTIFRGNLLTNTGPLLMVLAMSLVTIRHVYTANKGRIRLLEEMRSSCPTQTRRHTSSARMQTQSVVGIHFFLILKFLCTHCIACINDSIENFSGTHPSYTLITISNLLVVINSATNGSVYLGCVGTLHRKINSVFRRVSSGPAMMHKKEVQLLKASWQEICQNFDGNFGLMLMLEFLQRKPSMGHSLGLDPKEFRESWAQNEAVIAQGHQISELFHSFITLIDDFTSKRDLRNAIRTVGAIHYNHGVVIDTDTYLHFKYWTLQIVSCTDTGKSYGEEDDALNPKNNCVVKHRAWEKLICLIISEMKIGYSLQSERCNRRRDAVHYELFDRATIPPRS